MAHYLPPELIRQVNKLEWPKEDKMNKEINVVGKFHAMFFLVMLNILQDQ